MRFIFIEKLHLSICTAYIYKNESIFFLITQAFMKDNFVKP